MSKWKIKNSKGIWKNSRYTGAFNGAYERDKKGERIFVLTNKGLRRVTFESFQAAKKLGWKKQ